MSIPEHEQNRREAAAEPKYQDNTRPQKKNKNFNPCDDAKLREGYSLGEDDHEIAARIGCTARQVCDRRRRLRLMARNRPLKAEGLLSRGSVWTDACLAKLASLYEAGASDSQIASELRRTEEAVMKRRQALGLMLNRKTGLAGNTKRVIRRLLYVSATGEVLDPSRVLPERITGGRFQGYRVCGDKRVVI